jgi:putative hydrolase of the HAD superfamily
MEKYKLYILSNFSKDSYATYIPKRDLFKEFDGMLFSFQVGYIKPENEIYELLLKRYALVPQECVFIDDMKENVTAAQELGLKGIVYKKDSLEPELEKLGIKLSKSKR